MAKKLNKKVVFIGSALLVVIALGAIVVMLNLSKDPAKYVQLAQTAWDNEEYDEAGKSFNKAVAYFKSDAKKVDLLYTMTKMYHEARD
jgi:hypothetical protein